MTAIDLYDDLLAARDSLVSEIEDQISALVPADLLDAIAEIRAEAEPRLAVIDDRLAGLKQSIQDEALAAGKSQRSPRFIAVYSPSTKFVKADDVLELAARWQEVYPLLAAELRSIVTLTKPTVRLQARRDSRL